MSSSLKRVLRIRGLQEELARIELEREAARLRGLERLAGEAASEASASRARWFAAVAGDPGGGPKGELAVPERRAEDSIWEMAVWRRAKAEAARPARQAEVDRLGAKFLEGRQERMQVETLVEAAEALERRRGDRREQRGLDDWYQSRPRKASPPMETGAKRPAR